MTKQEILNRLSVLPQGGITVKKIKGKNGKVYEYHFLQWRENGKQKSRALKEYEIAFVQSQLEERKRFYFSSTLYNLCRFIIKKSNLKMSY